MADRLWVIIHLVSQSHHNLCHNQSTGSKWHCTYFRTAISSHIIWQYLTECELNEGDLYWRFGLPNCMINGSMWVRVQFPLLRSLFVSYYITNRKWVTLRNLWPWSDTQVIHQRVRDCSTSAGNSKYMIESQNRMWVILSLPLRQCNDHLITFSWPTVCEQWQFCLLSSLIIYHPLANSLWVTLHFILANKSHQTSCHNQRVVSDAPSSANEQNDSDLLTWPIGSQWHFIFSPSMQSQLINSVM